MGKKRTRTKRASGSSKKPPPYQVFVSHATEDKWIARTLCEKMESVGAAWGRRQDYRITAVLCHANVDVIPDMLRSKKAISLNDFDTFLRELKQRMSGHGK